MTLMKLKLDFLFIDLSQHFGTDLVVFALMCFIHVHGSVRGDVKSTKLQPKYKSRNFQNLIRKYIAQKYLLKPKTNRNFTV